MQEDNISLIKKTQKLKSQFEEENSNYQTMTSNYKLKIEALTNIKNKLHNKISLKTANYENNHLVIEKSEKTTNDIFN